MQDGRIAAADGIDTGIDLLFAAGGELRNLSFTFTGLSVLAAFAVDARLAWRERKASEPRAHHEQAATQTALNSAS